MTASGLNPSSLTLPQRLMSAYGAVLVRYAPPGGSDDVETGRKYRQLLNLSLIIIGAPPLYIALYLYLHIWVAAIGAASAMLVAFGALERMRRGGSPTSIAHLLGLAILVAMCGVSVGTGGLQSPALSWFIFCPAVPAMVAGRRAGLPWLILVIAWFALLYGLFLNGVQAPNQLPTPFWQHLYAFLAPVGLVFFQCAVTWSYEVGREDAIQRIDAARGGARRLLDTVTDGLIMVSLDGGIQGDHSAAATTLIPGIDRAGTLWAALAPFDAATAEWVELGWEDLSAGFMPASVILAQLPRELTVRERQLELTYHGVFDDEDTLTQVLVVFSDVTARVAAECASEAQEEMLVMFLKMRNAPGEVSDFVGETRRIMMDIERGAQDVHLRRWVHTLKGSSATFGLTTFARFIHRIEDDIAAEGACSLRHRRELVERWRALEERLAPVLQQDDSCIAISRERLASAIALARSGAAPERMARHLELWTWHAVAPRLQHLADRGADVAERLGKTHVRFVVDAEEVVLSPAADSMGFWNALVHVVRNAIDHGIESPEERVAAGKRPLAVVRLSARTEHDQLVIEVGDDGRGIDWERLRDRARKLDLPCKSYESTLRALFADGVTTVDEVTELSGRGLGMSALMAEVTERHGAISVDSKRGQGTTFRFTLPLTEHVELAHAS